jgi:hypothetical protein
MVSVIDRLYVGRMKHWHYAPRASDLSNKSIDEAVPWWRSKIDLPRVARDIGYTSLNNELIEIHGISIESLCEQVNTVLAAPREMYIGPVHGDLHATNVNLDSRLEIYLIDFGNTTYTWRAIDFVILEAAVKFVAAPAHAPLESLLECENLIDAGAPPTSTHGMLYGTELGKIVAACTAIRRHCNSSKAEVNLNSYRAGMIGVAAAFTSIEWWVNRRFLFHSIAYQLSRMATDD